MIDISINIKEDKAIINYDLEDNKGDLFFDCLGVTKENSEWPDKTQCYISMQLHELMNNLKTRMKEYFIHMDL